VLVSAKNEAVMADHLLAFCNNDQAKLKAFKPLLLDAKWSGKKLPNKLVQIDLLQAFMTLWHLDPEEFSTLKDTVLATINVIPGTQVGPSSSLSLSFSEDGETETDLAPSHDTQQGATKRPALCRSIWKGTTCETETSGCTFAHPRPCNLQACKPKRDYRCVLWHGRNGTLAVPRRASGNSGGGRGKPPPSKNPNGKGLGLRDLQKRLVLAEKDKQMSDLRLEVQRLKHKTVPNVRQRTTFAAAAAAPIPTSVASSMVSDRPAASLSFLTSTQGPASQQHSTNPTLDLVTVLAEIQLQLQQQKMQIALLVSKQ
jgi:hypothetical protein